MRRSVMFASKLGAALALCAGLFAAPQQAAAVAFVVDDTTDDVDALPGDCVCATAAATCTLRAAIQEANACAGSDSITLPAGTYALTLLGSGENAAATGDLDITDTVRIIGAAASTTVIDAGSGVNSDRVFDIRGATADLRRLEITGGRANSGAGLRNLAGSVTLRSVLVDDNVAAAAGGGIRNTGVGSLTIRNSEIEDNNCATNGGGISNTSDAVLDIVNSSMHDNFAGDAGGALHNTLAGIVDIDRTDIFDNQAGGAFSEGGGIANIDAWLTLRDTTITNNIAGSGGGIYHEEATFFTATEMMFVTIDLNQATGAGGGGGIFALDGDLSVNLTTLEGNVATTSDGGGLALEIDSNTFEVFQSSISGNSAASSGGGVYYVTVPGSAGNINHSLVDGNSATIGGGLYLQMGGNSNMTLSNNTFSGNTATGTGGGLWLNAQNGDIASLSLLTITGNSANLGGGVFAINNQGLYPLSHVLLAENTANAGDNCDGVTLTSNGFNLIGHDVGCNFAAIGTDQVGLNFPNRIDPLLGPLQDNGGSSWTHELLQGSPAIDAGAPSCNPNNDQRYFSRPVNDVCDVGAFEVQ